MREELLSRLVSAAQNVVNDAEVGFRDNGGVGYCTVDAEILDDLKKVVREIHDEAVAEIEAIMGKRGR